MANQAFELTWKPQVEDYREMFVSRAVAAGARRKLTAVYLVAGVPFLYLFLTGSVAAKILLVTVYLALGLLVMIATGPAQLIFADRFWRKYPLVQEPSWAGLNDKTLDIRTGDRPDAWPWSLIDSVSETDNLFVVQLTIGRQRTFTLLAKRGLVDPADLPGLRDFLDAHVPARSSR